MCSKGPQNFWEANSHPWEMCVSGNQGLRVLPQFLISGMGRGRLCFSEGPLFPVMG